MRNPIGSRSAAALGLAVALAACGTSSAAEPSPSTSHAPATPRPTPRVTPLPSFAPFDHGEIPAEIVGSYTFTVFDKNSAIDLEADGTYVLWGPMAFGQRQVHVTGEYGVFGDRMRFGNEIAASSLGRACTGDGEYRWSFDGETLLFTLLEDECALDINRQAEWQSGWTRVD
jgi:hypothetical protein